MSEIEGRFKGSDPLPPEPTGYPTVGPLGNECTQVPITGLEVEDDADRIRELLDFIQNKVDVGRYNLELEFAPPRCEPGVMHYNCEHARAHFAPKETH